MPIFCFEAEKSIGFIALKMSKPPSTFPVLNESEAVALVLVSQLDGAYVPNSKALQGSVSQNFQENLDFKQPALSGAHVLGGARQMCPDFCFRKYGQHN